VAFSDLGVSNLPATAVLGRHPRTHYAAPFDHERGCARSLHPGGLAADRFGRAPGYLDRPDCAAASAVTPELPRLSARGVPLQAGGLEVLSRHRDPEMHRRAEVEHQWLGHMRSLARTV
jgi:hypothetical protein